MKNFFLVFYLLLIISNYTHAQESKLPKGWDKISLNGKIAYMNLITGDVSKVLPVKPASKPLKKEKIEYDPTITHIVQKGETLSIIARKYNLNLGKLYQLNSLENFDTIEVGDEVVVGYEDLKQKKEVSSIDVKSTVVSVVKMNHIVSSGDTLYSIAKQYGKSVSEIKSMNNLKSNTIFIGQRLFIE